jgi:hypothetical protein
MRWGLLWKSPSLERRLSDGSLAKILWNMTPKTLRGLSYRRGGAKIGTYKNLRKKNK